MERVIFLILFVLMSTSCTKDPIYPSHIQAFGHGGLGISSSYPINSFESLVASLALGVSGTEIDVQMTSDGVLVAFHDENLDNSTNSNGLINDYSWNNLRHTYYNVNPYLNYKLCSLEEFFDNVPNLYEYDYIFDLKTFYKNQDYKDQLADAILNIITKYQLGSNVMIEAKEVDLLEKFKNKGLRLIYYTSDFQSGLEIASREQYYGIAIEHSLISKSQVALAHANQLKVTTFNVHNKKQNKSAANKGIDYIQTNKVKHLVDLLK